MDWIRSAAVNFNKTTEVVVGRRALCLIEVGLLPPDRVQLRHVLHRQECVCEGALWVNIYLHCDSNRVLAKRGKIHPKYFLSLNLQS